MPGHSLRPCIAWCSRPRYPPMSPAEPSMKGIVGKKLGMTRVFDPETGNVTPVTVIEAEPCPVVQLKTADADGYDAVQIAYEAVPDRKVTKAEVGHLKKNGVDGAYRHLVELRGQSELI